MITKEQVAANPKEAAQMIAVLTKENDRLRLVLGPFAKEADSWSDEVSNGYRPGIVGPRQRQPDGKAEFSIGDLRRARKLLSSTK